MPASPRPPVRLRPSAWLRTSTWLRASAWLLLAALAVVTLVPIGLRPVIATANLDRALAYAAFGLVLGLAYPRRWPLCLVAVAVAAGLLEVGQALTMTRHARLSDFLLKAGAAGLGVLLARVLAGLARRAGPADRA